MSQPFGAGYAAVYDALYRAKDYRGECDLLERLFAAWSASRVATVLDLGCGTGGHALELAVRGYRVTGVDRSQEMLAQAQAKRDSARLAVEFHHGDLRQVDLAGEFDAVIMMFAVLGYQTTTADAVAALRTARRHLRPGGLLIADVWYGPAVLHDRPGERVRVIDTDGGRVLRAAHSELDTCHQVCTVSYHVWQLTAQRLLAETTEEHRMRYFFPGELELLLQAAGLELAQLRCFPEIDAEPSETSWNVVLVARAGAAGV